MGRHLDSLELSTDGPLAAFAIRAAMEADRAEARSLDKRRGCRIRWGSVHPTRFGLVVRMARDLVAIRAFKGDATADDLVRRGWTPAQITTLRAEAVPIANRLWRDRGAK